MRVCLATIGKLICCHLDCCFIPSPPCSLHLNGLLSGSPDLLHLCCHAVLSYSIVKIKCSSMFSPPPSLAGLVPMAHSITERRPHRTEGQRRRTAKWLDNVQLLQLLARLSIACHLPRASTRPDPTPPDPSRPMLSTPTPRQPHRLSVQAVQSSSVELHT